MNRKYSNGVITTGWCLHGTRQDKIKSFKKSILVVSVSEQRLFSDHDLDIFIYILYIIDAFYIEEEIYPIIFPSVYSFVKPNVLKQVLIFYTIFNVYS